MPTASIALDADVCSLAYKPVDSVELSSFAGLCMPR